MLTENCITERNPNAPMFFNPGSVNSWRDCPIFGEVWRYKWEGRTVFIENPKGDSYEVRSWKVLEISEPEYLEWERDVDPPVVRIKDVADYIREKILNNAQARKAGSNIR